MKLFLSSSNVLTHHAEALRSLASFDKAQNVLCILAGAVPYGLDERPEWLERSISQLSDFFGEISETILSEHPDFIMPENLNNYDAIFVSGGNVAYLMNQLQKSGFDVQIREYIKANKLYIGSSAGGCIMSPNVTPYQRMEDTEVTGKSPEKGLNILSFGFVPHADNPDFIKHAKETADNFEKLNIPYRLIKDDQVMVVNGGDIKVI